MDTQGFALGCHITPRWGALNLARAPPWYHDIPARIRGRYVGGSGAAECSTTITAMRRDRFSFWTTRAPPQPDLSNHLPQKGQVAFALSGPRFNTIFPPSPISGYHAIGGLVENIGEGRPYTLAEYEEIGRKADLATAIACG